MISDFSRLAIFLALLVALVLVVSCPSDHDDETQRQADAAIARAQAELVGHVCPLSPQEVTHGVDGLEVEALKCAFAGGLAGRDWARLSPLEQSDLVPYLAKLYVATKDPLWAS